MKGQGGKVLYACVQGGCNAQKDYNGPGPFFGKYSSSFAMIFSKAASHSSSLGMTTSDGLPSLG